MLRPYTARHDPTRPDAHGREGPQMGGQMPYDKTKHQRRSIRLAGHNHASPGAYFVTICVHGGECLLGEVVDGGMHSSDFGRIADNCWPAIPDHIPRTRSWMPTLPCQTTCTGLSSSTTLWERKR